MVVTPEPELPDAEPASASYVVRNTTSGGMDGIVQAGVVHGGVHLHTAPSPPAPVVPHQLPGAPGMFAGRAAELAELGRVLGFAAPDGWNTAVRGRASADLAPGGGTVLVSVIGGAGGIGKTWLALAWAYRHLDRFPDGQLFVDLQRFSPAGTTPMGCLLVATYDSTGGRRRRWRCAQAVGES